jgi:hypothetical protein
MVVMAVSVPVFALVIPAISMVVVSVAVAIRMAVVMGVYHSIAPVQCHHQC